ncbi:MAG: helix-turn-helix domain-containing protein [Candidatus Pacebacteria bacterium]|nr:helix-turn-helix domain-containing protein [Candidatus Paceibacterota bacterium]
MKYNQLTAADRGAIEVLLKKNYTLTEIANEIGFHKNPSSSSNRNTYSKIQVQL